MSNCQPPSAQEMAPLQGQEPGLLRAGLSEAPGSAEVFSRAQVCPLACPQPEDSAPSLAQPDVKNASELSVLSPPGSFGHRCVPPPGFSQSMSAASKDLRFGAQSCSVAL